MQEKQNLFTQLGDILRKAGEGNGLSLEVSAEGENRLDVAVELRNRETGEVVVNRFHVTGEPSVLDNNFGKTIVEPLRNGSDEKKSLEQLDGHMQELQEQRDKALAEEKAAKETPAPTPVHKKPDDGRANVFKAMWTQAVEAKKKENWAVARDFFSKALEIASDSQKDAVQAQLDWCNRKISGM